MRRKIMEETPFACDMSVFEPEERRKHTENTREVFKLAKETKEISNGFVFLFPNESKLLMNLMSFVEKERLCCPFFGFIIEIEPDDGDVRLKIFGRDGVKDFIKAEIGGYRNK
jgi:hypothetical protein